MTHFEFHACDAENEILRYKVQFDKNIAKKISEALGNKGRYFTIADIKSFKEQLQSIIK